jgi:hypothetical protein
MQSYIVSGSASVSFFGFVVVSATWDDEKKVMKPAVGINLLMR